MKVIVFGATGKAGQLAVRQALAAGHDVTAYVRNPECAVRVGQRGAFGRVLQNGQLLSQGEVFESKLAARLQARSGSRE
jgi:uncharacterized protein YbjT (DUF2867 family)